MTVFFYYLVTRDKIPTAVLQNKCSQISKPPIPKLTIVNPTFIKYTNLHRDFVQFNVIPPVM